MMKHFEACGFKSNGKGKGTEAKGIRHKGRAAGLPASHEQRSSRSRAGMATEKQVKKIYAMWWAMPAGYYEKGKQLSSLRGFLKKRFRVDHENFLTFRKAGQVIEAIKAIGLRSLAKPKASTRQVGLRNG